MKREIWTDIIEALDELRNQRDPRRDQNQIDPRQEIVGDPYSYPAQEIWIDELDWDSIEFGFEGQIPRIENREPSEEEITSRWREFVFDTCAWYRSYHYLPRNQWGIHLNEDCWISTANRFFADRVYRTFNDALKGAFMYIFLHEFFHYIADVASSVVEIVSLNPSVYESYSKMVYAPSFGKPSCIEEALANRYLYGRNETIRLDRDYLYLTLRAQPPGYSRFAEFLGSNFWRGRRSLMNYVKNSSMRFAREEPIEQLIELLTPWHYSHGHRVPIWLHRPPRAPRRIFFPQPPIPKP